jgi:uncharacterized protein YukE
MNPLVEKIAIVIATGAIVAGAKTLWDWNTTDDEVLPTVAELTKQTEQLTSVVGSYVTNQAQQTLRVTSKDIAALESKPKQEWTPADQIQYETSQSQFDDAMEQISKRNAR